MESAQSPKLADLPVDLLLNAVLQLLLGDLEERVFGRFLKNQLLVDELVQNLQPRLQELGGPGRATPSPRLHREEKLIEFGHQNHGISDDRHHPLDQIDTQWGPLALDRWGKQQRKSREEPEDSG